MTEQLKSRLELFVNNETIVFFEAKNSSLSPNYSTIHRVASLIYTAEGKAIDCFAIRECFELVMKETNYTSGQCFRDICSLVSLDRDANKNKLTLITKKTTVSSAFKGHATITIATLLSLCSDPSNQLSNTLLVYGMMCDANFKTIDYLAVASYLIASCIQSEYYLLVVRRIKVFYDAMKRNHWFIGGTDYLFAAMMGLSDVDIETGIKRIEKLYFDQLTQGLVLSSGDIDEVAHVHALQNAILKRDFRLNKIFYTFPLAVLSLLTGDVGAIADDFVETYKFLRKQKGLGFLTVRKQELLVLSEALVAYSYLDGDILSTKISRNVTAVAILQQMILAKISEAGSNA